MDRHDIMRIAVDAGVDMRTVRRFLDGKPIRPLSRRRIEGAAEKLARSGIAVKAARGAK